MVEMIVSTQLLEAVGINELASHLRMFDAVIVSSQPDGVLTVFTLDVPGAPDNASRVEPIYGTRYEDGKAVTFLMRTEWRDANGQLIATEDRS
jgi:hypothetical protein